MEISNEIITIQIEPNHKIAAHHLKDLSFILHKGGKYYLKALTGEVRRFKNFSKYYKQKHVDDASKSNLSSLLTTYIDT